jgi:hypothetical protein
MEECGEVFHDRDVTELARCIVALADPELRRQKGSRGQEAIYKRYNWNYDSQILVQIIETVGTSRVR